MKALDELSKKVQARSVLGIDASTRALAWTLMRDGEAYRWGKRDFVAGEYHRLGDAREEMSTLLNIYSVDFVALEGAVYINNRQTVINLAMVFGCILSEAVVRDIPVDTVAPMTWMNYIGNGRLTKAEKAKIRKANPDATSKYKKKKAYRAFRKQRTIDFARKNLGIDTTDDDIADSSGVAYYACKELTRR